MKSACSVLMLVMLLSVASALTCVGELDDGSQVIYDESYTALVKLDSNNLRVNNMFGFQMFPTVFAGDAIVTPSTPVAPVLTPGQSVNE